MNALIARGRFVAGFVETSIAKTATPAEAEEHRALLAARPDTLKKTIGMALCDATMRHPKAAGILINRRLPEGVVYAGAGSQSIAYRIGDEVVKVDKASIFMSENERIRFAASEQTSHDTLRSYLGSLAAPQIIQVGAHPIKRGLRAVQMRQPFYDYDDLGRVFSSSKDTIDTKALDEVLSEHPTLDETFYTLATQGLAMAEAVQLAPDTLRRGNLGITRGSRPSLVLVDSQPVSTTFPEVQDLLLPQLESLRNHLSPALAT